MTDTGLRRDLAARAIRATLLTSAVAGLALSGVTPLGIRLLFGEEFSASVPIALVLIPATLLWGVKLVLADILRAIGKPKRVMVSELVGMASAAVLLAMVLRRLELMGAAIASLVSYALLAALLLILLCRELGMPMSEALPRRGDVVNLKFQLLRYAGKLWSAESGGTQRRAPH